ncbi:MULTISPECIES: alpha/beta fold hydrolase [Chryseobacterium]|uniref:Esterase n=1 Tax=Chryseobacterium camelliae TaxID=1265445 RepID=A0ABU0TJM1_9FLAO|nr:MULTISPECIES: alpha/beta fold hydrolase [Chryseobacterium]MDT3409121.1 esterase [Pseudacidovorax intermedius]MDQ1097021.1 esterase [Chryseobacterium camelliae]MDQ1100960.1 esterase [Chryseobacterium sp. SORGH_AS_1048]MDR6084402.1 esterase [Chryseobacterium sp. SORGH_AS_0909]MDR6132673.1 esterase [Chryseobacterium sp. SORGH_AS_1175]
MEILHSKIFGEQLTSTPLLVFHGLFGMLDNWGSFGKEMGELLPVHLIDLRNHGRSFHSENMSHDDLAGDIVAYMNHYGIDKAHVLGHSLGGKAVMQFAIRYPEKVEKLIVVDIAPKAYPPHHQGIIKALESVDFNTVKSRTEVENVLSQYIHEKSTIQFLTKNLYWDDDKKLNWRFNLKTLSEKYNEFVANAIKFGVFNGETLFIAGEKSNYILPQDEFAIRQQFPKAKIVTIKNAAHWVQADNPVDFSHVVKEFLNLN